MRIQFVFSPSLEALSEEIIYERFANDCRFLKLLFIYLMLTNYLGSPELFMGVLAHNKTRIFVEINIDKLNEINLC